LFPAEQFYSKCQYLAWAFEKLPAAGEGVGKMHGSYRVVLVIDKALQMHQARKVGRDKVISISSQCMLTFVPAIAIAMGSNFTAKVPPKPQQVSTSCSSVIVRPLI
jgi:hypothetical protein